MGKRKRSKPNIFEDHYVRWRTNRFDFIVNYYGKNFFKDKTLLELGSGRSDLGYMFYDITKPKTVTSVEARQENVDEGIKLYKNYLSDKFRIIQHDLEKDWTIGKFDIILNTGVLYHLGDPEKNIIDCCNNSEHLILETIVSDSNDPNFVGLIKEDINSPDQSYSGCGNRPSAKFIENLLGDNGFEFERMDDIKLNSGAHKYDWVFSGKGKNTNYKRRLWFCKKGN